MTTLIIESFREKTKGFLKKSNFESALFWADKVATLSNYHEYDAYSLVQAMFSLRQYNRAAKLIESKNLHKKHFVFKYYVSKCYYETNELKTALDYLEDICLPLFSSKKQKNLENMPSEEEMLASIYLLKGDIYRALEVKDTASDCYRDALVADVYCFEAFSRLVDNHLLKADEEIFLLDSLNFEEHCNSKEEAEMVKFLYSTRLKKYDKPEKFEVPAKFDNLHSNLDVATSLAERHYYNGEMKSSFQITERVMSIDPYHTFCLPLHIALLVQLKKPNKLFYLAHKLVDLYPDLSVSWYAVGCFYLMQATKQNLARRYLEKATLVDSLYGPAFLAYGHSFANGNEHDQAMAAYFKASLLMPGCHLPFLYIGIEYSITSNPKLAERFFMTALNISPKDPHVLHELGVTCYVKEDYPRALDYFNAALTEIEQLGPEVTDSEWEPLLNNLGHAYRKLQNFEKSLHFHLKALALSPKSAQTYSSVALVYCYMGNLKKGIEHLHRSLSLCHDNAISCSLLENVLDQYCKDEVPEYVSPTHQIPCTSRTVDLINHQSNPDGVSTKSLVLSTPQTPKIVKNRTTTPQQIGSKPTWPEKEEDMELDDTL